MTALPETKYAKSGEFHIAYQVIGTGPLDLVFMHGWISHIEHMWEEPRMARFLDRLAPFARLIVLDKRGTGLSDPVPLDRLPTLEERMDDLRAVMDAVGSERAALMGTSEAGALSLLFATTYPSRTAALVLLNSYVRLAYAPDYPYGIPADQAQVLLQAIDEGWGKGVAFEALVASQANNAPMRNWWSRYQRLAASPGAAVTLLRSAFGTDARAVLAAITVPVLVLHRAGDPFTGPEHGRYLAERIHGARYVELSGVDHLFFAEDVDRLLAEVQEFLTGVREAREPDGNLHAFGGGKSTPPATECSRPSTGLHEPFAVEVPLPRPSGCWGSSSGSVSIQVSVRSSARRSAESPSTPEHGLRVRQAPARSCIEYREGSRRRVGYPL